MSNADQAAFWDGDAGDIWVAHQADMDALLSGVLARVLSLAQLEPGLRVLDVGCGTGDSSIRAARITSGLGEVLGADISRKMLDHASARARQVQAEGLRFAAMDVAEHDFDPARFDRVISRFGVMFFADPVAAFANIARAMKPGATMAFASWGQIEENPYFTLPARIARDMIGAPPKTDPDEPGPFAFRDIEKVRGILQDAGLREVEGWAQQFSFTLPGGARQIARLSTHIGPAHRALTHFEADDATRQALEDRLTEAIAALPGAAIPAQINFFTAMR